MVQDLSYPTYLVLSFTFFMTIDPGDYSAISPKDLPYLNIEALAGRPIPLHSFHDGNRWNLWVPLENGLLQPLRVHDCIEMIYRVHPTFASPQIL